VFLIGTRSPEVRTIGQFDTTYGQIYLVERSDGRRYRSETPATWRSSPKPPCRWMTLAIHCRGAAYPSPASRHPSRKISATPPRSPGCVKDLIHRCDRCGVARSRAPTRTGCARWPIRPGSRANLVDGPENLHRNGSTAPRPSESDGGARRPRFWCRGSSRSCAPGAEEVVEELKAGKNT